jgi:two-component system LytT family response regulator
MYWFAVVLVPRCDTIVKYMTSQSQLTCIVVDDEVLGRTALRTAIVSDKELVIVGEARDGQSAYDLIVEQTPKMLFLDIVMPDMSGLELLQLLRSEAVPIPTVVFVTAWDRYALQAFEEQAADYLLKPFDEQRFRRACGNAKKRARAELAAQSGTRIDALLTRFQSGRIAVRERGRITFIDLELIDWIEADANYLRIHVGKDVHITRETLQAFESRLPNDRFLRVHRSAIVNTARIAEVQPWYTGEYVIKLDSKRELTLTRTYRDKFFSTMKSLSR